MNLGGGNPSVLQQLIDMFQAESPARIRSVCEQNAWNVELCIDQLISSSGEGGNENNTKDTNSVQPMVTDDTTEPTEWPWHNKRQTVNEKPEVPQGAIPKSASTGTMISTTSTQAGFDQQRNLHSTRRKWATNAEQKLADQIVAGYKVLVLMRGAPGCGKSYLAGNLVESNVALNGQYRLHDFVLSTDDYFYDSNGRYKYNASKLEDAHSFNHRRVREKTAAGWSPLVVDNTNMQLWEMLPYVQSAVRHGYIVQLLEPSTSWRYSAGKLALKNRHRVTREKIQIMLDKYERGTVNDLLKMLKDTKYTLPLPQMRSIPAWRISNHDMHETQETFKAFDVARNNTQLSKNTNNINATDNTSKSPVKGASAPKAQRKAVRSRSSTKVALSMPENNDEEHHATLLKDVPSNMWQPYEQEANKFWGLEQQPVVATSATIELEPATTEKSEKTLLDLLKEGVSNEPSTADAVVEPTVAENGFRRHSINCANENLSFTSLRQIYPNKQLNGLWDLFVKCNGDIDWAVDILLKEDELAMGNDCYEPNDADELVYVCNCDGDGVHEVEAAPPPAALITTLASGIKPQRAPRARAQRIQQNASPALLEVKEAIENRFVLGEEHYSTHVKRIKNIRSGNINGEAPPKSCTDSEVQTEPVTVLEADEEQDDDELLEITLGEQFVQQLSGMFSADTLSCQIPSQLKTNVFMPKSLAKELFMLWMESAYNQMEEQRQHTLREDEDFARLLKNPKYAECKESPENVKEILDMEMAWMIYKSEREQQQQQQRAKQEQQQNPRDIATHLTQMKLCEIYPNIPRETLLDILAAHGNKYNETVQMLEHSIKDSDSESTAQQQLLARAMQENALLNNQTVIQPPPYKNIVDDYDMPYSKSPNQAEDAKRLALREFEDTRNFAAHHCQLKAECYQKAKEAIQRGNSAVAVYYSQIANLHKKKIDMYNHRAANCIMEVHKHTQNNPDLLDLHYLHVVEAVGCLDLFLDRHITCLRSLAKSYKHIFIITGRGLHSAGGVSAIKNRVKSRLKERSLRWSEVNPGLLKVKIFSASRYSKNI